LELEELTLYVKSIKEQCINLVNYLCWMNHFTDWVTTEVLCATSQRTRIQTIKFFIDVLYLCWEMKNINSSLNLAFGLQNISVSRLKQTWKEFDLKYPEDKQKYTNISESLQPQNRIVLRKVTAATLEANLPCIPLLSIYTAQLTRIKDGKAGVLPTGHLSWDKYNSLAMTLQEIGNVKDCATYKYCLDFKTIKYIVEELQTETFENLKKKSEALEQKARTRSQSSVNV